MRRTVFCMYLMLFTALVYAKQKHSIDGVYMDEYGNEIIIKNCNTPKDYIYYTDRFFNEIVYKGTIFYYVEHKSISSHTWHNDTLAICSVVRQSEEFIELNSIQSYRHKMYQGFVVQTEYSSDANDSIEVQFDIPYDCQELHLIVSPTPYIYKSTPGNDMIKLIYSPKNNKVKISRDVKDFSLSVEVLQENVVSHDSLGRNYGELDAYFVEVPVENNRNLNKMRLYIPAITNDFFEKYYIVGEYVKVTTDDIVWKGRTFKKVKNAMM